VPVTDNVGIVGEKSIRQAMALKFAQTIADKLGILDKI
jgi:hypothetical protein